MAKKYNTFQYYNEESSYVSPAEVSKETIKKIKSRNIKLGKMSLLGEL